MWRVCGALRRHRAGDDADAGGDGMCTDQVQGLLGKDSTFSLDAGGLSGGIGLTDKTIAILSEMKSVKTIPVSPHPRGPNKSDVGSPCKGDAGDQRPASHKR
jgi:hypothetical protein